MLLFRVRLPRLSGETLGGEHLVKNFASKPLSPVLIGVTAVALTFVPVPRGEIRMIQVVWFALGLNNGVLAAVLHGAILGGLAYAVFCLFRWRGYPITGNVAAIVLTSAYVYAYFHIGMPMVG